MKELQDLKSLVLPAGEREEFLNSLSSRLTSEECGRIRALLLLASELVELMERKNLSITRLRELVFGATTESARNVCGCLPKVPSAGTRRPGHGRRSHKSYRGARRIRVPHQSLKAAQECPTCRRGKLRLQKQPATSVQLSAQPPIAAVIHEMERLRCDTCGEVFAATAPPEAGREKFDPTVGVLVGLLRFGTGMPFHRLERLQQSVGVPLPASVQWEQALRTFEGLEAAASHLLHLGAQRAVFHNDDTTMRIAAVRKEIQAGSKPERTGIFTTGIVCEGIVPGVPSIHLVFTGRKHAGENLARVLEERESGLPAPLQMCDALDRNLPEGHGTELCHCILHARRNFIEIRTAYPRNAGESWRPSEWSTNSRRSAGRGGRCRRATPTSPGAEPSGARSPSAGAHRGGGEEESRTQLPSR